MEEKDWRKRWNRWLGQKCRRTHFGWTELLGSDWRGWAESVLYEREIKFSDLSPFGSDRSRVYEVFKLAIKNANCDEFRQLDSLYATDQFEKRYK